MFDYIFYLYYSHISKRWTFLKWINMTPDVLACTILWGLVFTPLVLSFATFHIFTDIIGGRGQVFLILVLSYLPFFLRYFRNANISKDDYALFCERWGKEPAEIRKKRKIIVLILTVISWVVFPGGLLLIELLGWV